MKGPWEIYSASDAKILATIIAGCPKGHFCTIPRLINGSQINGNVGLTKAKPLPDLNTNFTCRQSTPALKQFLDV